MRICKFANEKLPVGIRKFVNGYCMRNCLEVLKNSSMRNCLRGIRTFVNEKLPRGIGKFVNEYCMRNCLEVSEYSSMRNCLEVLENSSMGTA